MHARAAIAAIVLWIVVPGAALAGDDAADFRREGKVLEAYRRVDFAAALGECLPAMAGPECTPMRISQAGSPKATRALFSAAM